MAMQPYRFKEEDLTLFDIWRKLEKMEVYLERIYYNTLPTGETPQPKQTAPEDAELDLNITTEHETRATMDTSTNNLDHGVNSDVAPDSRHLDSEAKAQLFSLIQQDMMCKPTHELSSRLYRTKIVRR